MFGSRKSPLKFDKHSSVEPVYPVKSGSNPFDSDDDEPMENQKVNSSNRTSSDPSLVLQRGKTNPFDDDDRGDRNSFSSSHALQSKENQKVNSSNRTSSDPSLVLLGGKTNPFDDDGGDRNSFSSSYALRSANQNKYRNDFRDSGGIENQSVQELEDYAVYKAGETTKSVKKCLKIAEDMREDATKTLVTLHQQGEQITRSHNVAVDIDQDLSRGEKLLGKLGGIFSKTWKPKKTRPITGPLIVGDDQVQRKGSHLEQRQKFGLTSAPRGKSNFRTLSPEPTNALEKAEIEKRQQDDALSDLSNILGELKDMAIDMGSEIERHNKALGHMENDVDELNYRVKGANQRGRRLLGK
ncbi:hypothetical protein QN277_014489 [Acacia crassicarpa]|uniref:t-SNARE coiled-coil homology domain-containing protein n=1 Tax=Acacia crassicarpa TaxID=499986 RepID=A0AAE1ILT6_9FABA|nr:hypothetical protein QN277_014489 [Acacia crassicarpa]